MRPGFATDDANATAGGQPPLSLLGLAFCRRFLRFLDNVDYARVPIKVYPQHQQQHKLYYKMIWQAASLHLPSLPYHSPSTTYCIFVVS